MRTAGSPPCSKPTGARRPRSESAEKARAKPPGPPFSLVHVYGPTVRLRGALEITKLSRTTWLDLVRAGKAPAPFYICRCALWLTAEIGTWLEDRVSESRGAGK